MGTEIDLAPWVVKLDNLEPDWALRAEGFTFGSYGDDILTRVFGDYRRGLEALGIMVDGVIAEGHPFDSNPSAYETMQAAWEAAIKESLASPEWS